MDIIWMIFAIFLFILCAVLLVLEIFIPSFGLITLIALSCLGAGMYLFFQISTSAGWTGAAIAFILIPIVWILMYKLFPVTRIGKHLLSQKVSRMPGDAIPDHEELKTLLGKSGTVISPLRPVGTVDFKGQHYVCVAETGFVEKNKNVKVIEIQGNKITVRVSEQ